MPSREQLITTVDKLQRMSQSVLLDGDIDVKYFEDLIETIYTCSKWITPQLAEKAKEAIDTIEQEIRTHLRTLLKYSKDISKTKRALSMYNSFHYTSPIIGFNRNA